MRDGPARVETLALVSCVLKSINTMQTTFLRLMAALTLAFLSHPALADDSSGAFSYTLVGIAEFDGISYASLVDQQTGDHFLLTTAKKSELDIVLA